MVPRYRYLYFVMALPSLCNCTTEPLLLCDWAFIAVFSGSSGICFSILSTTICHPMLWTRRPLSQYKGCYEPAFKPQQPCRRFSLLAHWRYGQVSVSAMLVDTLSKNIAQAFILERYFFVSIYPAASHGTCLAVFLAAVLPLC